MTIILTIKISTRSVENIKSFQELKNLISTIKIGNSCIDIGTDQHT